MKAEQMLVPCVVLLVLITIDFLGYTCFLIFGRNTPI